MLSLFKESQTRIITGLIIVLVLLALFSLPSHLFPYVCAAFMIAISIEWYNLWKKYLGTQKRKYIIAFTLGLVYMAIGVTIFGLMSTSLLDRILLMVLLVSSDAGAYFFGKAFGKRKILPQVSPGKTWEGLAGGMLVTAVLGSLYAYGIGDFPIPFYMFPLAAIVAHVGDFLQSAVKRYLNVKDSGSILPGHGGLLDRLDSAFTVIPFFYLCMLSV